MRGIDRFLYDFEAPESGDGGGAPAPEAAPPPEPEAAAPEIPAWAQPLIDFQTGAAPVLEQLSAALQYDPGAEGAAWGQGPPEALYDAQTGQPLQDAGPRYDPFDPDSVNGYIEHAVGSTVERILNERLGPMEPLLGHIAQTEGERIARERLTSLQESVGAFDQDQAVLISQSLLQQGVGGNEALEYAAKQVKGFEDRIRADERAKVEEHYRTIAGAPRQAPNGGAVGSENAPPPDPRGGVEKYTIAVNRAMGQSYPVLPTG